MALVSIGIKGTSPLLMHRFAEVAELDSSTRKVHREQYDPRTEAEKAAYRSPDGNLYMPGAAIARLLREAAGNHKQRGSRKSMKYVMPSAVLMCEDTIPMLDADSSPITTFEIDSRPVVIPATKGRIMRHRPRLNAWGSEFFLEVDESLVDLTLVHECLSEGGARLGIGDFRPEKGGPFGRFQITSWSV